MGSLCRNLGTLRKQPTSQLRKKIDLYGFKLFPQIQSKKYTQTTKEQVQSGMAKCEELTSANIDAFLTSFDTVLLDCDGVIWHGPEPIKGTSEAFQMLQRLGKKIFPVTNNSTKTRKEYETKCNKLGFPVTEAEIIGTAFVTSHYLRNTLKYEGKIFLLGSSGLYQELTQAGYQVEWNVDLKVEDDVSNQGPHALPDMVLDPEVKCVVVGFDMAFNYAKLTKATSYIKQKGTLFIATNTDSGLPLGSGKVLPGTGAIVGSVQIAVGRPPDYICGKPHFPIFEVLHSMYPVHEARTIVIGDRLDTDIELAHNCGLRGVLVLTGFSSLEEVSEKQASQSPQHQKQVPHYYIQSLGDLPKLLEAYLPKICS